MQPETQTISQVENTETNNYIKASAVYGYPSRRALLNPFPALLIWNKDNTINLKNVQSGEDIFSCPVEQIKKIFYMTDHTTITLRDGRKFMIGFNKDYMNQNLKGLSAGATGDAVSLGTGAVAPGIAGDIVFFKSMFNISKMDAANDSLWWTTNLARYGVKTTRLTYGEVALLTILGLIAIFVIFCILFLLVAAIRS